MRGTTLLVVCALGFLLLVAGCIETDGPPRKQQGIQTGTPPPICPGTPARAAVNPQTLKAFFPCCEGRARWVPSHLIPGAFQQMLEKHATKDQLCVPEIFASDPNYTPQACTSIFGMPGACISSCVPQVKNAEVPLPQGGCPQGELCSPCYDPRTFEETGACKMGAMACGVQPPHPNHGQCKDFTPTLDLSPYTKCCPEGRAHCAPPNLVSEDQRGRLSKCDDGQSYCVPDDFLSRGGRYTPPKCLSVGNSEGRCLSVCVPEVKSQLDLLPVSTCQPDERCVPCYDPRTDKDTGACTQGHCDPGPSTPPPGTGGQCKDLDPTFDLTKLTQCCQEHGGKGHCAGPDLVTPEQRDRLSKCSDGVSFCVPDDFLSRYGKFTPKTCRSVGNLEGRCLSVCVTEISQQKDDLPVDSCKPDERCVPCYDPRTDKDTGACTQGFCDQGPKEPPPWSSGQCKDYPPIYDVSSFPQCCQQHGGRAHCAKPSLVSDDQKKQLGLCNDGVSYCVPDDFLTRFGKFTPIQCKSVNGAEGRCLSVCVPEVEQQMATLPTDICKPDERCVPCYDPRTGLGTGACTQGYCDKGPSQPPKVFQKCGPAGSDHAFCVPATLLPPGERHNFDTRGCLSPAACTDIGTICVPKKVMDAGTTFSPRHCKNNLWALAAAFKNLSSDPVAAFTALLSSKFKEGRCLSTCIPQVRPMASKLQKQSCDEHEVCVPCIDPTKLDQGEVKTGACDR